MIDVEQVKETCKGCRYTDRNVFEDPCKSGLYMIHYSGKCAAYRPTLLTRVKNLAEKLRGGHHE